MSVDTEPKGALERLRAVFGREGLMAPAPHRGTRIETNEGMRGYSTRTAVYLRHAAYLLVLLLCSSITHWAMEKAGPYSIDGGQAMFFMTTLLLAVGAGATVFYTAQRNQILEETRHYVFGLMALPGTGIALVMWLVQDLVLAQANPDAFSRTLDLGLLMAFGACLIMPPIVFIKVISGIRGLSKSTMDDQESMQVWSRQDGRQR